MKAATISKDPFNLNDGIIRHDDCPFMVTRQKDGSSVVYTKTPNTAAQYKPYNMTYWGNHELCMLNLGTAYRFNNPSQHCYMVELKGSNTHTNVGVKLQTKYAGITLSDWLCTKVNYSSGLTYQYPFYPPLNFLSLMKQCVLALKQLTEMGIRHGDIKADNICIPFSSKAGNAVGCCQEAKRIVVELDELILIDFAFAISNDFPLQHSLPQEPHAYYSPTMQKALISRDKDLQQALDWRADVYSLGYMLKQIIEKEGMPIVLIREAKPLIEQMLNIENASVEPLTWYDGMCKKIDAILAGCSNHKIVMSVVATESLEIPTQANNKPKKPKPDDVPTFYKPLNQGKVPVNTKEKNQTKPKKTLFKKAFVAVLVFISGLLVYMWLIRADYQHYANVAQKTGEQYLKIDYKGKVLEDDAPNWNCVYDSKTNLLWEEKDTYGLNSKDGSYTWYNPHTNSGNAGYKDASEYWENSRKTCDGLSDCNILAYKKASNEQGICGFKDWQLPTLGELKTLLTTKKYRYETNGSKHYVLMNTRYFRVLPENSLYYWSSSPVADLSDSAWVVGFNDGNASASNKYHSYYVRLVRTGQ